MSRIAKAPITIPEGVNITHADGVMSVSYTHLTLPTKRKV